MTRVVLAAVLVAFLPGALAYRAPVGSRPLRAALTFEERQFWAILLSFCWSLAVVLALAAADAFTFDRLLTTNAALCGVLAVVWRQRLRYDTAAPGPTWRTLIPIGLIALGTLLYFPTSEYVIGGKDPGTYINEGVQIAQRRGLFVRDPLVSSIPAASRDLFFPWHRTPYYYGLRFMGFFIQDPNAGEVVGQFPHLFPASIAIGYEVNGLTGARDMVAIWAIAGLVAVYLCGARFVGAAAAAAASALLAVNVIQLWFARYPNSEIVMQALVFSALLAFARAAEGSRGFFGTIAGALVGFMLFLRYDIVLAIVAMSAAVALLPVAGRRAGVAFGVATVTVGAVGLWYLAHPMIAYAAYPLGFTRDRGGWWLVGGGLAALAVCRVLVGRPVIAGVTRRWLPRLLAVALAGLAAYAYFWRVEGGTTAVHDAMAFRTFAWYVTPWLLAAIVAGLAIIVWARFWDAPALLLTLATFSLFFFYKTRIVPEHFWASRRFLAVILPGALLVVAGAAAFLGERLFARFRPVGAPRGAAIAGAGLVAVLFVPAGAAFWRASEPVRAHVEYAGLIPQLETLAGRIGTRDLLIVESRNAGSDLHVLALPLAYIYAKQVLVLESPVPPKRALENFVAWAQSAYDHVLFLGGGGTDLLTRRLTARSLGNGAFHVTEYESRLNDYPRGPRRKDFEFGLFQLSIGESGANAPIDLDIGGHDDLNVVRFHARERAQDGETFRWTGPQSFVLLLGVPADATRIVLWMGNGGRPANAPPAVVEVALGEVVIGTVTVGADIAPHEIDLPPDIARRLSQRDDPVRLRLRVAPWIPAAAIGGGDTRELGVMVTRVQVQ